MSDLRRRFKDFAQHIEHAPGRWRGPAVAEMIRDVLAEETPQPAVPEGGESAAPQDGGSTPPDGGLGPCQREGCMNRLLDENFGPSS